MHVSQHIHCTDEETKAQRSYSQAWKRPHSEFTFSHAEWGPDCRVSTRGAWLAAWDTWQGVDWFYPAFGRTLLSSWVHQSWYCPSWEGTWPLPTKSQGLVWVSMWPKQNPWKSLPGIFIWVVPELLGPEKHVSLPANRKLFEIGENETTLLRREKIQGEMADRQKDR